MIAGTLFRPARRADDGGFVGFLLLVSVFFRPVEKINAVLETYPKGIAGFRRYTRAAGRPSRTSPTRPDADRRSADLRGEIRYEDVTLRLRPGPAGAARHRT